MFLASQMPERTVLMVTGRAVGLIEQVAVLARQLCPSTVLIEDVDLIAEDRRSTSNVCALPVMFELLNAMDGLSEDADVRDALQEMIVDAGAMTRRLLGADAKFDG